MIDTRSEARGPDRETSAYFRPEKAKMAPTAGQRQPLFDDDDLDDWHPALACFAFTMSRLRPSPTPSPLPPTTRPLRVVAVGTLFLTHTLSLPTHPGPGQSVRAHEYSHSRGGSAPAVLSALSQLNADKCWLVASLGGAQEARAVARELEAEGVSTRYCKVWEGAGVPAAWILHASEWSSPLRTGAPLMPRRRRNSDLFLCATGSDLSPARLPRAMSGAPTVCFGFYDCVHVLSGEVCLYLCYSSSWHK